jgi:hypothetical protein
MSDLFDLDAVTSDSEGKPFGFTWGGQEFTLPALIALPIDRQIGIVTAAETLPEQPSASEVLSLLTLVVGDEMLQVLGKAKPLSTVAVIRLLDAWMGHERVGKSPASPASSASTAKPSRQTSRSGRARKTN